MSDGAGQVKNPGTIGDIAWGCLGCLIFFLSLLAFVTFLEWIFE